MEIVNADLVNLGMSTVEIVVHEKRNKDQDGELVLSCVVDLCVCIDCIY